MWSSTIPTACIYAYTAVESTKQNPRFNFKVSADKTPRIRIKMPFAQNDSPLAALHVEQIIPKSHVKTGHLDNLALACIDCDSQQKEQT
jgi:hypothetical protein